MCIIGYAPANHTIDDDTIRTMFQNNPDGAGIMWIHNGIVEIRKGFFDVEKLIRAWHMIPLQSEKAMHCRIATHGRVNSDCCHPFPVRKNVESMTYRIDHCDQAIMHNGIITLTSPSTGIRCAFSDTMMFAANILANVDELDNEYVQDMLERAIGTSRLLIFRSYGNTIKLGNWVKEGKLFFSNTSYRKWYSYYSGYSIPTKTKGVQTPVKNTCEMDYDEVPELYDDNGESLFLADDETRFLDEQKGDVK